MTVEWVPGTVDPSNGLERGKVPQSWTREIPLEERIFSEERHRPFFIELAKESGSQAMADFISEIYELKNPIILSQEPQL